MGRRGWRRHVEVEDEEAMMGRTRRSREWGGRAEVEESEVEQRLRRLPQSWSVGTSFHLRPSPQRSELLVSSRQPLTDVAPPTPSLLSLISLVVSPYSSTSLMFTPSSAPLIGRLFNNPLAADAVLLRRPLLTATHGERRGQCRSPPSFPFPPPFFSSLRRVFSPPPPGPDQSLRYVLVFPISLFLLPSAHFHHPPSTVPAFTSQAHRPCPSNVSSTLVILSLLVFSIIASARIPLAPNRDRPSRERPRPLQLLQEHRLHGHGYAL